MKCDLHVHSYYSGPCTPAWLGTICRESYSDPAEVLAALRCRGMNLFTLTDHDSIEGCAALRGLPNFFLSEELTCRMPSGTQVHVGVYDITERQHIELQRRRNDLLSLLAYLSERRILYSVNHVFSALTGQRTREDFDWFRDYFPAMETQNGHMLAQQNEAAAALAARWGKIALGGSDAHALPSVGTAFTEVPGARDKIEFFDGLRAGYGRVHGESGDVRKLTRDVILIAAEMMREKNWTALLAPFGALIPAVTFFTICQERSFARRWSAEILGRRESRPNSIWVPSPQSAWE